MKTLVIGSTGLVGQALLARWRAEFNSDLPIIGVGSADGDLGDELAITGVIERYRPDWIVLSAAMTNVDACELDANRAHSVNALGPAYVSRACRRLGAKLLFVSTDYVFDGKKTTPYEPSDATQPLSVYGRSKADGETAVREELPEACIARTSWVFGSAKPGFPGAILDQAEKLSVVPVIADQISAPTYAPDLAEIIIALVKTNAQGIVHACGASGCTRVQWAQEILRAAGKTDVTLKPVTNLQFHRPAPRPPYSVMSTQILSRYGLQARSWQAGVADYVIARNR